MGDAASAMRVLGYHGELGQGSPLLSVYHMLQCDVLPGHDPDVSGMLQQLQCSLLIDLQVKVRVFVPDGVFDWGDG